MVVGSILVAIATGLYTTFSPTTPPSEWIPYQIIYGIGVGLAFQQPYTAMETVLPNSSVATTLVVLSFTQEMGGIVALSIAQNLFTNRLFRNLKTHVPGLDPSTILVGKDNGVLGIVKVVPERYVDGVKSVYNDAIVDINHLALALTCLTVVASLLIEWKSVKEEKVEGEDKKEKDRAVSAVEEKREEVREEGLAAAGQPAITGDS